MICKNKKLLGSLILLSDTSNTLKLGSANNPSRSEIPFTPTLFLLI